MLRTYAGASPRPVRAPRGRVKGVPGVCSLLCWVAQRGQRRARAKSSHGHASEVTGPSGIRAGRAGRGLAACSLSNSAEAAAPQPLQQRRRARRPRRHRRGRVARGGRVHRAPRGGSDVAQRQASGAAHVEVRMAQAGRKVGCAGGGGGGWCECRVQAGWGGVGGRRPGASTGQRRCQRPAFCWLGEQKAGRWHRRCPVLAPGRRPPRHPPSPTPKRPP
jgi:hypothetical protein